MLLQYFTINQIELMRGLVKAVTTPCAKSEFCLKDYAKNNLKIT